MKSQLIHPMALSEQNPTVPRYVIVYSARLILVQRVRNAIPQRFLAAVGRHCAQHAALLPSLFQLIASDQFSVRYCPSLIASLIQQRQLVTLSLLLSF